VITDSVPPGCNSDDKSKKLNDWNQAKFQGQIKKLHNFYNTLQRFTVFDTSAADNTEWSGKNSQT